jgi:Aminoglycoside-2''-adenylyltransferase
MTVEDLGARQLAALGRVGSRLESEGIAYWLFGGWAVDFYAGSVTRAHDDVDIAIWLTDLPRIATLLESDGWRHAPAEDEDGGTGYEHGDVRLELTYLTGNADGDVFIPLRDGPVPWAKESFADDLRELSGVRARVITLTSLRSMKSWPRDDPGDAAKDRADLAALPSAWVGDARQVRADPPGSGG